MSIKCLAIIPLFVALSFVLPAWAGEKVGNGGDSCENRFNLIREDLKNWILSKGSTRLTLPQGLDLNDYNRQMLEQISNAKMSCSDKTLTIGNAEKTCKNFLENGKQPRIECNVNRFIDTQETDQYVLVHHEFAGLAGFEINEGEKSQYFISNQITKYLENQIIRKLVVKEDPDKSQDIMNALDEALKESKFSNCNYISTVTSHYERDYGWVTEGTRKLESKTKAFIDLYYPSYSLKMSNGADQPALVGTYNYPPFREDVSIKFSIYTDKSGKRVDSIEVQLGNSSRVNIGTIINPQYVFAVKKDQDFSFSCHK